MDITFKPSTNLIELAKITFNNMEPYYRKYSVDWRVQEIVEKTSGLENFDILHQSSIVGVLRLQYDVDYCYLRDIQVDPLFQNKGIGKAALMEAKRLTLNYGLKDLKLRVFKISPAINLYKRNGFTVESEDDRFFNMVAKVS